MLIFMNMCGIFLQLTTTDSTRLKIDYGPTSSKKTKIEQKQVYRDKLQTIFAKFRRALNLAEVVMRPSNRESFFF
jgi:exonuclease I